MEMMSSSLHHKYESNTSLVEVRNGNEFGYINNELPGGESAVAAGGPEPLIFRNNVLFLNTKTSLIFY